jgi:hypothetical protein
MARHKLNRQVSRICRNVKNLNSINQSKSLVGGNRITSATFVNDNLRHYQFVSVAYFPPSPRRKLTRCDDDVSLLSRGDMPNNSRFNVHGRFAHCSLYPNVTDDRAVASKVSIRLRPIHRFGPSDCSPISFHHREVIGGKDGAMILSCSVSEKYDSTFNLWKIPGLESDKAART